MTTPEEMEAARLAGWSPDDGDPPVEHALPPPIDPELGHNGVPAPEPGDPDFTGSPEPGGES